MFSFNFWLSLWSLLVPVSGGFYFLHKWYKAKQKYAYLLFFGLSLFFIQLFKLPNILINAGFEVSQAILEPYFWVTLTLHILSYYFLATGFLNFYQQSQRSIKPIFLALITLLIIYYFISFFIPATYPFLPVWPGHIFFFIPAQLITLLVFYKSSGSSPELLLAKSKFFIIWSLYLLFATSIAYMYIQTGPSSQSLWYVYVTLSWGISVLQILAMVFLFLGLYFMAKKRKQKL